MRVQEFETIRKQIPVVAVLVGVFMLVASGCGGASGNPDGAIGADPSMMEHAICADEGPPSYVSDAELLFSTVDPDAVAYCEREGCIGREEAICRARLAGVTDGSTGIKATLVLMLDGPVADLDGNPIEPADRPAVRVGPYWNVWNLLEDRGHDGKTGELLLIDAHSGDPAQDEVHGWLTSH